MALGAVGLQRIELGSIEGEGVSSGQRGTALLTSPAVALTITDLTIPLAPRIEGRI
jgi:hypothetical protein